MRCPACGLQVNALFYPRHDTISKAPHPRAYRCCDMCLKDQPLWSQYAKRRGFDEVEVYKDGVVVRINRNFT